MATTRISKLLNLANTGTPRVFAFLADDHRLHFSDIDRCYSVVCSVAGKKKFVDFWVDNCCNLVITLNNDGDLELYRTKTLLSHEFQKKSEEIKKGGDSIHRVQTLLSVLQSEAYSPPTKVEVLKKERVDIITEEVAIDEKKLLRENWICKNMNPNFNLKALRSFLRNHAVYPDQYRATVWTFLLSLPKNVLTFDNYLKKGAHKDLVRYEQTFPLKNEALAKKLGRVLSSLSHYCGLFSDQNSVPFVAFPFVKLFSQDECLSFEVILSFYLHWGQHMFENFPHPSSTMIDFVNSLHLVSPFLGGNRPRTQPSFGLY